MTLTYGIAISAVSSGSWRDRGRQNLRLILWIVQKVEKFPKSYRFSVGQRLIDVGLDLLLLLVEAAYWADKRDALRAAGVRTNALRYLLRLPTT